MQERCAGKIPRDSLAPMRPTDDEPTPPTTRAVLVETESEEPPSVSLGMMPHTEEDVRALLDSVRDAQADPYSEEGRIAAGGMGFIDLVHDRVLQRRAAMKRIHPHLQNDPRTMRMFVREAQVTGQLDHPNIVPVHELRSDSEGRLFFTMKLVEGRTFSSIIRDLPEPLDHASLLGALDVIVRVCDALAFAHSRGVIHCDIKPANVMVGEFGEVYLMDWGVALVRDAESPDARAVPDPEPGDGRPQPTLIGTPSHMSPEQAMGALDTVDERSDVFAVGALIYQVITRRSPFGADSFWAIVLRAQLCSYTPIYDLVPEHIVPRALVRLVDRAMSAEPQDRPQNIVELKTELLRFMRGGAPFPSNPFEAGDTIVREGDHASAAFIIHSGRCEVRKDGRVLRVMGPGEVFGETAILSAGPRTASVVAIEPTVCQVITADVFEAEVDSMKPWMGAFVRTLASRFREREE